MDLGIKVFKTKVLMAAQEVIRCENSNGLQIPEIEGMKASDLFPNLHKFKSHKHVISYLYQESPHLVHNAIIVLATSASWLVSYKPSHCNVKESLSITYVKLPQPLQRSSKWLAFSIISS